MSRRFVSVICNGAATALLVCASAIPAEPVAQARSLPQWMLRAQERLGLQPAQQRQLRALVDENAIRLDALRARHVGDAQSGPVRLAEMAALQREFREALVSILTAGQLVEWDLLIEELLGEVHLRNAPRVAEGLH